MDKKSSYEASNLSVGSIDTVREDILNKLLITITIIALPPLIASLYRIVDIGWQNIMYFHVIGYLVICVTAILHRKIIFFYKALITITFCFLIGCIAVVNMGILGSGVMFMFFSIILATMFLGVRYGGVLIIACLALLVTVALGVSQGWILFDFEIEATARAMSTWISRIFAFVFFTTMLIASLGRLISYLVDSSNILKERTEELKQTNKKVIKEITGKKSTEEELRKSEEKYRILYENANDAICIAQDEMLKFPNPMTENITGYSKEELTKIPFTDLIHPEDRAMVLDRHKKRLSGEEPPNTYSFRIINKKGKELWVQLNVVFIDWEGRPASLNFLRDITQQRRLEAQLVQSQKMESIGTLAGGIAHDFNNILSPIMIHSEMAMMELSSDNPIQRNLQSIYKAGERAKDLVKQILTFARKREEEKAPIKISTIVKEVVRFLRSTIPSTIDIKYDFRTEQDIVLADPTQMNQIVMNLCTNAAHAMREKGGVLEVRLCNENIGSDEIKQFIGLDPGNYVRLSVKDSGPGIPSEIIDKIFEPYFTTKGPGEGTGMGLAVVHGIVQNYGGDIAVESKFGKGSTFHVLLPFTEVEAPLTTETKIELPTGKEHILLIDDEKVIVDIIQSMLENLGYKITARTSSIEALEAFRNKPEKYDLVITDMTMPNMTGKDLAEELMAIRSDIPIILCTGFSEQIDEIKAKGMGISAFIMKPVVARDIANTIREVLDKK